MLTAKTKLGPYEVLGPLGAGGMGEIYRAHDPRLGREVAIKILPASFCRDAERLRRFEQEARAAGALNHPNILAVYDVGTHDGAPYLVTELLEGLTLRDRLRDGPLSIHKAIDYAVQIAQGLAAAHEKGIVHRDLKPDNVFITSDGRAKILDFGLAKLSEPEAHDKTVTHLDLGPQTAEGVMLGTAGYMSPEQVRGQKADRRSDIFSFGVMLYEMLSGQRAFHRSTGADTASAILKEEPADLLAAGRNIPMTLDRIVRHCLEKNPEERFQSARDLAFHLESMSTVSDSGVAAQAFQTKAPSRLGWILAGLAIAILGGLAFFWWSRSSAASGPASISFLRLSDFAGIEDTPAFSPDGKSVAFVSDSTGSRQVWIRLLAGGPPLQVTRGDGDHLNPRWSQDSASILYYTPPPEGETQGTLWEISALGGAARRLGSALSGADTSHDGKHLAFFRLNGTQMELVNSNRDGSDPKVVSSAAATFSYRWARWSPDDKMIAYLHSRENWADDAYVVAASGGTPRQITKDTTLMSGLAWTPDGKRLVYGSARGSTLLYLPTLHLWSIAISGGEPQQLTFGETSDENPDLDASGRIVLSRKRMQFDIWKIPTGPDPIGNVRQAVRITHQTGQVQTPSLDPTDHEMVYLSDNGGHGNLWIQQLSTGENRQITFEKDPKVVMGVPVWSPDGKFITFASNEPGSSGRGIRYWLIRPDGSDLHVAIPLGTWVTWSRDSKWLYYCESSPVQETASRRLMKVAVAGGQPIVVRTDNGRGPAVAPDGSALYYVVPLLNLNGSLDYELRVARPEDGTSTLLARISGKRLPLWQGLHPVISNDGKRLAFPLDDDIGTNLWSASTTDGKLTRITDFGQKRTFIARRVSWSSDDKWVFVAVGEGDADIVQIEGLLR